MTHNAPDKNVMNECNERQQIVPCGKVKRTPADCDQQMEHFELWMITFSPKFFWRCVNQLCAHVTWNSYRTILMHSWDNLSSCSLFPCCSLRLYVTPLSIFTSRGPPSVFIVAARLKWGGHLMDLYVVCTLCFLSSAIMPLYKSYQCLRCKLSVLVTLTTHTHSFVLL